MRIDRLITLCILRLMKSDVFARFKKRIPILMYHSISDKIEKVHPYFKTNTSPRIFNAHMQYLKKRNYQVLSLERAAGMIRRNKDIPYKCVVITFDDGFKDFYTYAAPTLALYNFAATVFLPTGFISEKRKKFKGKECLVWSEIRELQKAKISFGSHSVSHSILHTAPWEQIRIELRESRKILEDNLEMQINMFSYPYAFPQEDHYFTNNFRKELARQGYNILVTTAIGRAGRRSDPMNLRRLPINSCDSLNLFDAKLAGAYDWVAFAQTMIRHTKKFNGLKINNKHFRRKL